MTEQERKEVQDKMPPQLAAKAEYPMQLAKLREQGKLGFINPYTEAFKWLFATATEGGAKC